MANKKLGAEHQRDGARQAGAETEQGDGRGAGRWELAAVLHDGHHRRRARARFGDVSAASLLGTQVPSPADYLTSMPTSHKAHQSGRARGAG